MDKIEETVEKKRIKWWEWLIIIVLILSLSIISVLLYARYVGTKNIKTNEIKLVASSLTDEWKGFKIVHISDIQYGKSTSEKDLKKLVEKVNLTKPDIIVLTGDLINSEAVLEENDISILTNFLNDLKATMKKYAVSGDNDNFFSEYETIIQNGGFINLDNDFDTIYNGDLNYILISGIGNDFNENSLLDMNKFLSEEEKKPLYKILLIHKPDLIDQLEESFDLVLAGHSLNGLVNLPIIGPLYLEDGAKKYYKGFYELENTKLYVSNGIGTNKYSFRLFNHPSFNFYRITNKQ